MPPTRACSVCTHPDRVAVDAALALGTPSRRSIAIQHPPLTYGAIARHAAKCVVSAPTADVVKKGRIADAAIQQVERATQVAIRDVARSGLSRASRHEEQLDSLWEQALGQLTDPATGRLRPLVDSDTGEVRLDMLGELLAVSKARVDARGGGTLKWATLVGELEGALRRGSQTLVVVDADGRVEVRDPEVARVLDVVTRALAPFPEAAAAVGRALGEMRG